MQSEYCGPFFSASQDKVQRELARLRQQNVVMYTLIRDTVRDELKRMDLEYLIREG